MHWAMVGRLLEGTVHSLSSPWIGCAINAPEQPISVQRTPQFEADACRFDSLLTRTYLPSVPCSFDLFLSVFGLLQVQLGRGRPS